MSKYLKDAPEAPVDMELAFVTPLTKADSKRRNAIPPVCQSWLGMAAAADLMVFIRTSSVQEAYDVAAGGFRLLLHTLTFIGR